MPQRLKQTKRLQNSTLKRIASAVTKCKQVGAVAKIGELMGVSKYIWMAVTADELELPLAVADTSRELAKIVGLSHSTIEVSAYRNVNGTTSGRKFVKVPRE